MESIDVGGRIGRGSARECQGLSGGIGGLRAGSGELGKEIGNVAELGKEIQEVGTVGRIFGSWNWVKKLRKNTVEKSSERELFKVFEKATS